MRHPNAGRVPRAAAAAIADDGRRGFLRLAGVAGLALLAGCSDGDAKWHAVDVTGSSPPLAFTMTRAADGKLVTQDDYRGKIVLLYFGYTFCPDICPTTLSHLGEVLQRLGGQAKQIAILFVTVDPNRDTQKVLNNYVESFGPEVHGLRGTDDQLRSLARRYRVVYSVTPASNGHPYEVAHSSAIYAFDGTGAARLLVSGMSTAKPDIDGVAADLRRLIEEKNPPGLWTRLMRLF